ncbi:TIR domain-containing protein [Nostoc sp.]|uniref:TIR domain-containing protein n=1 Tax=Nostoc sp. TaxID=1180 RepID=UPI002FFAE5CA
MDNQEALQRTLNRARRALQILEEEKASYGIRVPVDLQIDLEEKQKEVTSLEARLSLLQGQRPESVPDNLPRYNDVFVGRKQEIARCLEALSPEERGWGVAIDGMGGMGKTALALEVAHLARQQALFDAYLFVSAKTTWLSTQGVRQEIFALSSLDSFCREFAKGLGRADIVKMTDATERRRALLNTLQGRRTLLIWDNLETLNAEERDMIAEFLRKLPTPNKAIITSNRRTGESALTIRLDRLLETEALELMREKGRSHPRLAQELNATNPEILTDLYQASGGNPLALDWTLGQVAHKGYSISFALERLQNAAKSADLYGFLFADAAQTLSENDRTVLSALGVFLTPIKITALADATDLAISEIQVSLERLVTLSLVNDLNGERFDLHPLTRTYIRAVVGVTDSIGTRPINNVNLQAQEKNRDFNPQVTQLQPELSEKNKPTKYQLPESKQKEVFISYAWEDNHSKSFVEELEKAFQAKGIKIIRDKNTILYKGRIQEFMQRLSRGKCVILIISDQYLKSEKCMYELVEIAKNGKFYKRIFPIVFLDAQIHNAIERIKYIEYWEKQIKDLDDALKKVSAANLQGFREDIDLYTEIRNTFANITNLLKDMNALTEEIHIQSEFEALLKVVEESLDE